MGRKRKIPSYKEEEQEQNDNNVTSLLNDVIVKAKTNEEENNNIENNDEQPIDQTSPDWHNHVMRQFVKDEMDENNHPFVHGLRRVCRLLLGNVTRSGPVSVTPATPENGYRASVEYQIVIENCGEKYLFGATADASPENCKKLSQYPLAIADTRAEARAYRRALNLKCIAAEESEDPSSFISKENLITPTQLKAINKMCKDVDINVIKFLNDFVKEHEVDEKLVPNNIPNSVAAKANAKLNEYVQNQDKIKEEIKGYDINWN